MKRRGFGHCECGQKATRWDSTEHGVCARCAGINPDDYHLDGGGGIKRRPWAQRAVDETWSYREHWHSFTHNSPRATPRREVSA